MLVLNLNIDFIQLELKPYFFNIKINNNETK